jgi:protein required for attachment to host cells
VKIMTNRTHVPNGAWLLVADHSKAMLLRNAGTAILPQLDVRQVMEAADNPLTHDQGSDRPGRVFSGSHHSAVEETDLHAQSGLRFLQQAAAELEKARTEQGIDAIVLVAPPKALAQLRQAISDAVRSLVVGELDKDLVHMPVTEIAEHLAA